MRVSMNVEYFDKDKKALHRYDKLTPIVFFKFILRLCGKELTYTRGDSYELVDDEYGETLSSSDFLKIKKDCRYNHHFAGHVWMYDCNTAEVFMYNKVIHI